MKKRKAYFLIIISTIIMCAPFINQAIHIDDVHFIYTAKQIIKDPLHPYSFMLNWRGVNEHVFSVVTNPPLITYYLALIISLFGSAEVVLHAFFIPFSLLAAFSMYFLAKRFTKNPVFCAILLLASPAFMVMSHTLMLDVPSVALYLAAFSFFIYGYDKRDNILLILSGFLASLACLSKYSCLTIIPLLVLYVIFKTRKLDRRMLVLILPILVVFLWGVYYYIVYKQGIFSMPISLRAGSGDIFAILYKFFILCSYAGGAAIFPLVTMYTFSYGNRKIWLLIFLCASLIGFFVMLVYEYNFWQSLMLILFIYAGLITIWDIFKRLKQAFTVNFSNQEILDDVFLITCFALNFAVVLCLNFVAVRYILPAVPFLILLFLRKTYKIFILKKYYILFLSFTIVATFFIGMLVSAADYELAGAYRFFSSNYPAKYRSKYNTIWFVGHWGFQYYMEKNGYKALEINEKAVKKGDIIIIPTLPDNQSLPLCLNNRLEVIDKLYFNARIPVMVLNNMAKAGFYTNYLNTACLLPYFFSIQPLEQFIILLVNR